VVVDDDDTEENRKNAVFHTMQLQTELNIAMDNDVVLQQNVSEWLTSAEVRRKLAEEAEIKRQEEEQRILKEREEKRLQEEEERRVK